MLLSGTSLIFDPCGSEHKMSTCWTPPIPELGLAHPWSSMPPEDLQRPLSLKTTWKPGWNLTNTWACWDRGRGAGTPLPPPATSTNLCFLNAGAHQSPEEEAVTALQALEKITFLPCSRDHKEGVFYCRGLNDSRNHLGGKRLHLCIPFYKNRPKNRRN